MSIIKAEDSKKWINAFIAIVSVLVGYVCIRFFIQMGEWFDLEAKIGNFLLITQGAGILIGVGTFLAVFKHKTAPTQLEEIYGELVKVVWPDKDTILKITVALMIGLSLVAGFFVLVDFLSRQSLDLFYSF